MREMFLDSKLYNFGKFLWIEIKNKKLLCGNKEKLYFLLLEKVLIKIK